MGRERRDELLLGAAIIWLAALTARSYGLWGAVFVSTPWLSWLKIAGAALIGTPAVVFGGAGVGWGLLCLATAALGGGALLARLLPEEPPPSLCARAGLTMLALPA